MGIQDIGQVLVMLHSGSRGFGHQICTDYLSTMGQAVSKYGINLPDRQLACAPVKSPEGQAYLSAMACAAIMPGPTVNAWRTGQGIADESPG